MDPTEQLHILQTARDKPALLALAMVDLVHHTLPEAERSRVKDALMAAAVPHWCDSVFLAELLETTPEEGDRLLGYLRALTVVEPFPARGEHAVNVHEATRLALRDHLRMTDAKRWKALSGRAFIHVCQGTQTHSRIEALYHLFATDQQTAATVCASLDREFSEVRGPKVRHALALVLTELTVAGWLSGTAKIEARLASLENRNSRGEIAQLEQEARNVAVLARKASYPSGIARAQCLLGDAFQVKGRHVAALTAYRKAVAILQHLVRTDPSNTGWRRDLAVFHSRIGDIAIRRKCHVAALTAYRKAVAILQHLVGTDPSNSDLQDNLALAYGKLGDIALEQKRYTAALAAYRKSLTILQRVVKIDSSNAIRQCSLASTYSRVGDIAHAQGRHAAALTAYRKGLTILQRVVQTDPSNADWQYQLALAHGKLGDIALEQKRYTAALTASRKGLTILLQVVQTDPSNTDWQRELALAYNKLGQAFQNMENDENAQSSFRSAVKAMKLAIANSQGNNVTLKKDLANLETWLSSEAS